MSFSSLLVVAATLARSALGQGQTSYVDYLTQPQPSLDQRTLFDFNTTFPTCAGSSLAGTDVCNSSLSSWERASALISMFTLEEVVNNTCNTAPGVPRLGLPAFQVWNEALHGLDRAAFSSFPNPWSWATSFPSPILSMASMNASLIHQIGDIIGTQGRAYNNAGKYGLNVYSPNINGFRSPVWGRGQETPGEDAFFLSSLYAYEYITGIQGGVNPAVPKLIAVVKHFAGYDIDSWNNHSRLGIDVNITQQNLAGYFTPQFKAAVQFAKVKSLMCSYNAVNGVPSCSNSFLLQTLLRDTWGFGEGFVSSDCDAIYNVFDPHGYASNRTGAAADSLRAGTDIDCGTTYAYYLTPAFDEGFVSRDDIELALKRLFSGYFDQGWFDDSASLYRDLDWSDVVATDALNISYEAAVEGIVLLKNDGTLPLDLESCSSVALIGPWANATDQLQGNYYGPPPYLISLLAALQASGVTVNFANGTDTVGNTSTAGFSAAIAAANKSEVIIFAGGIDNSIEAEGVDRQNITWPGVQLELISQLSQIGKPLIVLQMGGGQVDSSSLKSNDNVNSLIWGGYPGQSGGQALLDIITGKRTPAGRLVTTQYPADYLTGFDQLDTNLAPDNQSNPGQTYMYYTGEAVYPFGYGLTYTTWSETLSGNMTTTYNISKPFSQSHKGYAYAEQVPILTFQFKVTNTGKTASDYSAMLFASTTSGPTPRPIKWLVGIDREATIAPGASVIVKIPVPVGALARADANGDLVVYPGQYSLALNPEASVTFNFTLVGDAVTIQKWPEAQQQIPPSTTPADPQPLDGGQ